MIKALIVDDEYIVLEGLKRLIDWEKYGIQLIGSAENGQEALSMINGQHPNLILTDIYMPGMDGLQLLEAIMKENSDSYVIVFSGFNEFEYVKRAIQLGASDYLEKPITVESVDRALQKAVDQINKHRATFELEEKYAESRQTVLEKLTGDLLQENFSELDKWKEMIGHSLCAWSAVTVLVCSQQIDSLEVPNTKVITLPQKDDYIIVLLHHAPLPRELWEEIEQHSDCYIGVGNTYFQYEDLAKSLKEAKRAIRCARYLCVLGLMRYEDLGAIFTNSDDISDREEGIILSLRAGNDFGLMEQIDLFIDWIKSEDLDPEVVEREMIKLLYLAIAVSDEITLSPSIDYKSISIQAIENKDKTQLTEWFREQFSKLIQSTAQYREDTKHATIEQAKRYIERHMSDDLNLQNLAHYLNMNPSYLSVLFKEVTGESYIKYVTRFRMEKAKKLLLDGLKVSEVSEKVGYYTYRHFTEVFKKYTGLTPGQYKSSVEFTGK